jgi:hypothetical protein
VCCSQDSAQAHEGSWVFVAVPVAHKSKGKKAEKATSVKKPSGKARMADLDVDEMSSPQKARIFEQLKAAGYT